MKKLIVLTYGVTNYFFGVAALVYLIAFLFNLYVPKSIDSGESGGLTLAIVINLTLIALFGLQHSIMARPGFKRMLARVVPEAAGRGTFMMATALVTFALCLLWQPMPTIIWQADSTIVYNLLLASGLFGWALVLYSSFLINHFDLFGLRQVWLYVTNQEYTPPPFKLTSLYKYIRHPIMMGVFIGIWITPVMTVGHLMLAVGMSVYIFIGVYHEEKDLISEYGERYRSYINSTAKFFPWFTGKKIEYDAVSDND